MTDPEDFLRNLPGAREIPDPQAEMERLAKQRGDQEHVPVGRRDLNLLLATAASYLRLFGKQLQAEQDPAEQLIYDEIESVVRRYGRRY